MASLQIQFQVQGMWPFPYDMLRYDSCYPATESDSAMIDSLTHHTSERATVTLAAIKPYKAWKPTIRRWESFGWAVVDSG